MTEPYPYSLAQALADVTHALRDKPEEAALNHITELLLGGADVRKDYHADLTVRQLHNLAKFVEDGLTGSETICAASKQAASIIRAFVVVRTHSRVNSKQKLRYLAERARWRARAVEAEAQLAQLDPTGAKRKPGLSPKRAEEQSNEEARTYDHP